jgi:hypothetical protein
VWFGLCFSINYILSQNRLTVNPLLPEGQACKWGTGLTPRFRMILPGSLRSAYRDVLADASLHGQVDHPGLAGGLRPGPDHAVVRQPAATFSSSCSTISVVTAGWS